MAWVAIASTAYDPDSPIDAALMSAIVGNSEYNKSQHESHAHSGADGTPTIEIGPNWLRNGGFSNGTTGWTATAYTGGTVTTGTSNETEGTAGAVITSTNATNGGGKLESNEFIPVTASQTRQFMMTIKSSSASCPLKAEVLWYDDAQASISNSTIVSTTTTSPTTDRLVVRRIAAPSTAKFCKIRLELPAAGSATGTVYFDSVIVTTPQMLGGIQIFTATGASTFSAVWGDVYGQVQGGGGGATSGNGAGGGYSEGFASTTGDVTVTVGAGGSTSGGAGGTSSFGSFLSGTGGGGNGGGGGTGSGGSINIPGRAGIGGVAGDAVLGYGKTAAEGGSNYGGGAGSGGSNAGGQGIVIVRW